MWTRTPELWLIVLMTLNAIGLSVGKPTVQARVELMSCTSANATIMEQCSTSCLPVQGARLSCGGAVSCTCTLAPPQIVQACMECQMEGNSGAHARRETDFDFSMQLARYLYACNGMLASISRRSSGDNSDFITDSPNPVRRDDICIFGTPEVYTVESASNSGILNPKYYSPGNIFLIFSCVVWILGRVILLCLGH